MTSNFSLFSLRSISAFLPFLSMTIEKRRKRLFLFFFQGEHSLIGCTCPSFIPLPPPTPISGQTLFYRAIQIVTTVWGRIDSSWICSFHLPKRVQRIVLKIYFSVFFFMAGFFLTHPTTLHSIMQMQLGEARGIALYAICASSVYVHLAQHILMETHSPGTKKVLR